MSDVLTNEASNIKEIATELLCRKHEANDWYDEYWEELAQYNWELQKQYNPLGIAVSVNWYEFYSVEMGIKRIVRDCLVSRRRTEITASEKLLKDAVECYMNGDKVDVDNIKQKYNNLGSILQRYFVAVLSQMNKITDDIACKGNQESTLYYLYLACNKTHLRGDIEDLAAYAV